jgi:PRTRC genetic system protein C
MTRIFVVDGREFPDPDAKLTVDEVRKQLTEFFPELANAETREEKRDEDVRYVFTKRIGTKGRRRTPDVVALVRSVPETRLHVFELAGELLDGHGEIDVDATAHRQSEINLAVAEAQAYATATQQATEASRRLPAR